MRKIYEVVRLDCEHGRSKRQIARNIKVSYLHRVRLRGPRQAGQAGIASARLLRRRCPVATAVPAQRTVVGAATSACPADRAQRTVAQGRDAGAAVATIQGRATVRLTIRVIDTRYFHWRPTSLI